jgi:8-oxo-dGTP pyrophosphatase MutT (NUDIX family)
MQAITYREFGVRSEVLKYHIVALKLRGMKDGKPFTSEGKIFINVGYNLCEVDEIKFFADSGTELPKDKVCLDTDTRVAGVLINTDKEVLLLKVKNPKEFYCFPGGHLRECESIEDCLHREMLEETGIDITGLLPELILETHNEGFGPEKFFLIRLGDTAIKFQDENPNDETSRLMVMPLAEVLRLENVFPKEVVGILSSRLNSL